MDKISLTALAREQLAAAHRAASGRSARTVYGGHQHALRQTVVALTAGSSLSDHDSPGEATLQVAGAYPADGARHQLGRSAG